MTMALVQNNKVTEVGLPPDLKSKPLSALKALGWQKVVGTPKPTEEPAAGYQWEYGASWSISDGVVYGTWSQKQRPQPYSSWSWVDGEGWVAPKPKPEGDYEWNEDALDWVEVTEDE